MQNLIPINIVIGDRTYRIKTSASEEETIRKTVKTINDKIVEFRAQYSGNDMQDYVSMVLIWFATQNLNANKNISNDIDLEKAILKLEEQLDKIG